MEPQVVAFAAHTAYLDPQTGCGLLVCPHPDTDIEPVGGPLGERVWLESSQQYGWRPALSLHWADWERAMDHLHEIKWEVHGNDERYDEPMLRGYTADGRAAYLLYGRQSIITEPSILEINDSLKELDQVVGIVQPGEA